VAEPPHEQLAGDLRRLDGRMLEQQPCAPLEVLRGRANDAPQVREPVIACRECDLRLESQRLEDGIGAADVGRVAQHQFEAAAGERREPITGQELDVVRMELGGVVARDPKRLLRQIGRDDVPGGPLARERQSDRARPGSKVGHPGARLGAQRERPLDQQLGLGARHENGRIHPKLERPELLATHQIRERLAARAARDEREVSVPLRLVAHLVRMGLEPCAAAVKDVREKQLRIELGMLGYLRQPLPPFAEQCGGREGPIRIRAMAVTALYRPTRPQSIGEVLDSGFRIFQSTLLPSLPYGVLWVLVAQLANIHDLALRVLGRADPIRWLWYALATALTLLIWTALILRQSTLAAGARSSMRVELREALARLPQLLALALMGTAGCAFGLTLLVVPGVYLAVAFVLAVPALLARSLGPLDALVYSARLVRGNWWRAVLVLSIAAVVMLALYVVLVTTALLALSVGGIADVALVTAVSVAAGIALGVVLVPFAGAMVLAIFGELRARREELDTESPLGADSCGVPL
jgi:hypothetical protein